MHTKIMRTAVTHDKNSPPLRHLCRCDEELSAVIYKLGDLSYFLYEDSFSFLIDTIIGQMLSNKVADVISARVCGLCEGNILPEKLLALSISELRKAGLSLAKTKYIHGIAQLYYDGPNFFTDLATKTDNDVIKELKKLRGVGPWSAKMYLIFVLDRHDILPFEDRAFQQTFCWMYPFVDSDKKSITEHCSKWSPYASIASRYLYKALDSGLTKQPVQLLKNAYPKAHG